MFWMEDILGLGDMFLFSDKPKPVGAALYLDNENRMVGQVGEREVYRGKDQREAMKAVEKAIGASSWWSSDPHAAPTGALCGFLFHHPQ